MSEKKIRVLMAKPGLDGHDRGVKTVIHALREAGLDVIYTGLHRTPDEIVTLAIEKKVDFVGLSILSGAHLSICGEVLGKMKEAGIGAIPLLVGGVIPERDAPELTRLGVAGVFPVDSPFDDIVGFIKRWKS